MSSFATFCPAAAEVARRDRHTAAVPAGVNAWTEPELPRAVGVQQVRLEHALPHQHGPAGRLTGSAEDRSAAVTIVGRRADPGGAGSRRSTARDWRPGRAVLVREGVLESYLLDTYSARKLGLQSTHHAGRDGSGVSVSTSNLMLLPGKTSPKELIGSVQNGFYVTELIGFGGTA